MVIPAIDRLSTRRQQWPRVCAEENESGTLQSQRTRSVDTIVHRRAHTQSGALAASLHSIDSLAMSARELVERRLAHDDSVHALAFLPTTPATLVSGGIDDSIKLWTIDKNDPSLTTPTTTLTAPTALSCLSITAPTTASASAASAASPPLAWLSFMDGSIRSVSDTAASFQHVLPTQPGEVWTLSHHPTLRLLASGSNKGHVNLWKLSPTPPSDTPQPTAAAADPAKQLTADSKAIAASRTSWPNPHSNPAASTHFTYTVAFSPTGTLLASTQHNGAIHVYSTTTAQLLHTFSTASGAAVRACGWCSDDVLVTGADDGSLSVWDVASRQQSAQLRAHASYITALVCYASVPASSTAAAIAPQLLRVVSASVDRRVKVWELSTNECVHVFEQNTSSVWAMCKHPTELMVATGSEDGTIRLLQLPS